MTKPKRHHCLPEFYLTGFTRGGGVFTVFDRATREYRTQTPINTAVMGHYYAFTNKEGETDYGIEQMLSTSEGQAKPIVLKLEGGEGISPEERVAFAFFLALLFNRGPKFEREIDAIADAAAKIWMKQQLPDLEAVRDHFAKDPPADESLSPEEFLKFIHDEEYELVGNRNNTIRTMLDQSPKIGERLAMMDWTVVHADERTSFITSDSPFAILLTDAQKRSDRTIIGLGSPEVTKAIPLTRRVALLLGGYGLRFGHARGNRDLVRSINIEIAAESERIVIAADEAHLRSVVRRSRVDRMDTRTRMIVEELQDQDDAASSYTVVRRVRPRPDGAK